jgi:hypothetical protein
MHRSESNTANEAEIKSNKPNEYITITITIIYHPELVQKAKEWMTYQVDSVSLLGRLIGLVKHATWPIAFPIRAVTFNFENSSIIPAYPVTFIGMLG